MDDEIEVVDDPSLRAFLPTSFGKQTTISNAERQIEQSRRSAVALTEKDDKDEDDDDSSEKGGDSDDDSETSEDDDDEFPVSHELVIKTHDRAVTTATLDTSGTRLITGSADCTLKFHDFNSMTPTTVRAFRSVDPNATKHSSSAETNPVHQVIFNPVSPSTILAITALPQAKVLDRDGEIVATTVKGDMYLRDMHNTKGHVSEITAGAWHPTNRNVFVTAGTDSTLRIWDLNDMRSQRDVVVYKSRAAGAAGRTRMTAVAWGKGVDGGTILVAAAYDGSLVMWNGEGPYSRPAAEIKDAHTPNTWTSGIDISPDGRLVITRGGDDTIKLWDTRKFKQSLKTATLPSMSSQHTSASIRFSPNGTNVLAGALTGHLHILNPATLRPEMVTPVTPGSAVITAVWHAKLNQIITGSANGETHVLYNPQTSQGGAKTVMQKAPKQRHIDDDPNRTMDLAHGLSGDAIVQPGGSRQSASGFAARHPQVGMTASGKSRDPRRPHIPASTPFAKSQPDEEHVKNSIPLSSMRDEDPREALLKYADKAGKDPVFTKAWSKTQPETIYADLSDEEEKPDKKRVKR